MSTNWAQDIAEMHEHYGFHEALQRVIEKEGYGVLKEFLKFRRDFLVEELNELSTAIDNNDSEEVVDALIDLCVVAIGTLDLFNVNSERAWDEVLSANMSKRVGVKATRPNRFGLPDLVKPEGWVAPSHEHNHGSLSLLE